MSDRAKEAVQDRLNSAIRPLSPQDAIDVLEDVSSHCDAQCEGIREDMRKDDE